MLVTLGVKYILGVLNPNITIYTYSREYFQQNCSPDSRPYPNCQLCSGPSKAHIAKYFKDGEFAGRMEYAFINDDIYEINYKDDRMKGFAKYTFANASVCESFYKNDGSASPDRVLVGNYNYDYPVDTVLN
jgi:hypothetical protein